MQAHTRGLALQARQLAAMLAGAETGVIHAMAAAFDTRFETLPAQLEGFGAACTLLEDKLHFAGVAAESLHPSPTAEGRAIDRRAQRELRRQGLEQAKLELAALPKAYDLHALHREALDTIHDHALIAAAIQLAALIAASLATSGAAAWLGGAVRGARLAGLAVHSVEAASAARGARVAAAGVELASDAILSSAAQSAITGENFGNVGLENLLANAGVRAALQQLAPLVASFDEAAMGLWTTGGAVGKTTVMLAKGTVVTGQLLIGAGVSYAVHRVLTHQANGEPAASAADLSDWVLQGTAMVVGHLISTRTHSLQRRLAQLGTARAFLAERAAQQQRRAAAIEARGDHGEAMQLLIEHRGLLADEARVLRELAAPGAEGADNPAKLASAPLSAADHRLLTRANANDLAATTASGMPGMEELPFRFAGIDELVPGALWSGTHDQITTALGQSRAAGLEVHILAQGDAQARWRLQLGKGRVVEIEEHLPRPGDKKIEAKKSQPPNRHEVVLAQLEHGGGKVSDATVSLRGMAQTPETMPWRPNADGTVRTLDEAVALARKWGVEIADDIKFFVREPKYLPPGALAEYLDLSRAKIGDRFSWSTFLNHYDEVAVKLSEEVLSSDEKIVAVIAHEMHELNSLRELFEHRKTISAIEIARLINPGHNGNLHDEAWDVADALVDRMRTEKMEGK